MIARKPLNLLASLLLAAFLFSPAGAADPVSGSWTIRSADKPERVQLSFVYGHSTNSSDNWRLADLKGLDLATAARHDVRFALDRDAGRIEAEGSATSGTAAGSFQFTPNPAYAGELRKLGLGELESRSQMSFALLDVSLAFAREMTELKLTGLTADKLLAMRIHGIDASYVKDLRGAGAAATETDQLVAFRIHHVTPDWVAGFAKLGYGGKTLSADQMIAFRIHDVTPDYVAAVEKLGYDHPAPDELIAMKIHGITPDYIASVKARGVRDITLDKLVAMKIQGID